jgi:formamidopyrimidine-DNA glycosylase
MLELPEALTIANQINNTIKGRKITNVTADFSPHKFAFYHGDPQGYSALLKGKTIEGSTAYGGMIHIKVDSASIVISDGINLRYDKQGQGSQLKHQLLLELDDFSKVSASVQMYGMIWCFGNETEFQNPYYIVSKEKTSPLTNAFDEAYFEKLLSLEGVKKLSVKAFLATEQRIPGLGNGVLQDILWKANINPKTKMNALKDKQIDTLFITIKSVLSEMAELRGRNTEKDFFGNNGGYETIMSKNNVGSPCPICGSTIKKENYMGGSVYYCENCQAI